MRRFVGKRHGGPTTIPPRSTISVALLLLILFVLVLSWISRSTTDASFENKGLGSSTAFKDEDQNFVLPTDLKTLLPALVTNYTVSHLYDSPVIIPAKTLRDMMEVEFIKTIRYPRRVFYRRRFPDINDEFQELVNMPRLIEAAKALKREDAAGSADLVYAVSKAKALLSSLRGTIADVLDERVEQRILSARGKIRRPRSLSRFLVLELADSASTHQAGGPKESAPHRGSAGPTPAAAAAAVLPLLHGSLIKHGVLRALTLDTAPIPTSAETSGIPTPIGPRFLWTPFVNGSATVSKDAFAAAERAWTAYIGSGKTSQPFCFSAPANSYPSPIATGLMEGQRLGILDETESLSPWEKYAEAVLWSYMANIPSPLHALVRLRRFGSTGGGNLTIAEPGKADEARLFDIAQETVPKHSVKEVPSPAQPPRVADPRVILPLARSMRPLVDIQIISSFETLYRRLMTHHPELSGHGGAKDVRSHFFIGANGAFTGSQAEFEAFLVFLLTNAREATYLEIPNLFACHAFASERSAHVAAPPTRTQREGVELGTRSDTSTGGGHAGAGNEHEMKNDRQHVPAHTADVSLSEHLMAWYVRPLLLGRTVREKSADGRYNPTTLLGKGPLAKPESKNRRVTSMAALLEAIAASYGVYTEVTVVLEEPAVHHCSPGSVAATAAGTMGGPLPLHAPAGEHLDRDPPLSRAPSVRSRYPRVVLRVVRDRVQLKQEQQKQPLMERLDCQAVPDV